MSLSFEPRTIFEDTPDREWLIVTKDRQLVALLIRLSALHGEYEGEWYVEWAFHDAMATRDIFPDLERASAWIRKTSNADSLALDTKTTVDTRPGLQAGFGPFIRRPSCSAKSHTPQNPARPLM